MARPIRLLAVAAFTLMAGGADAQTPPVDVSSFYRALTAGAGARAWSMGGTQIALSDAAEASTWNPAAAAALDRPAAFLVLSGDRLTGAFDAVRFALASGPSGSIVPGETTAAASGLRALQVAWPFRVAGRRLAVAVAYQRRLALPDRTDAGYLFHTQSLYRFDYDYSYGAHGTGGFDTVGVSVASNLGHGMRAGATIHRWFGTASSAYVESYRYSVANYYGWDGTWREDLGDDVRLDMSGFSVDLGAQVAVRDKYFAGVVFRSGTAADVDYSNAASYADTHTSRTAAAAHSGHGSLTLPASLGFGAGVRVIPRLTVAADVTWAFWSNATLDRYARVTALGDVPQAAQVAYPTQSPAAQHPQSDTARASMGVEYLLDAGPLRIPVRGGVFYEQAYEAAGQSSAAVTAGAGVRWRAAVFDVAWVRQVASGRYTRHSVTSTIGWTF